MRLPVSCPAMEDLRQRMVRITMFVPFCWTLEDLKFALASSPTTILATKP